MLYTRKGDNGTSGLFGTTERLPKDSPIYDALGTLDELNSLLGICRAQSRDTTDDISVYKEILGVQESLFIIQAEIAGSHIHIATAQVQSLENTIDRIEKLAGNPHAFVIPGGTTVSAHLDFARTVARRAERSVITACAIRSVSAESRTYLNRLSSLLYALARYAAAKEEVREQSPSYRLPA